MEWAMIERWGNKGDLLEMSFKSSSNIQISFNNNNHLIVKLYFWGFSFDWYFNEGNDLQQPKEL